MQLVNGDLWTYDPDAWIGITTNGSVIDGKNVLRSGCAGQFKEKYPTAETVVGKLIQEGLNHLHMIPEWKMFTFPTKYRWDDMRSDISLILQSSLELEYQAGLHPEDRFILPRPGVGAGHLPWEQVEALITRILPDNVLVITW